MIVPFNMPLTRGDEVASVCQAICDGNLSGNGDWSRRCVVQLEKRLDGARVTLTPSCTAALEMCSLLCRVGSRDEVIVPSYTFVTTASAFVRCGAEIVWCDIRPDTKNIDETLIERLVTERTRAVVVVHYGGVGCEMGAIVELCQRRGLMLVEDAAQAIDCSYHGKPLGTLGDLGTLSFHDTKNIHCGEGGALIVNNPDMAERAVFIRDKGTNRSEFVQGLVDKYNWVELGSSFLMSELQAAFLLPQLERSTEVNARRVQHWRRYYERLAGFIPPGSLPVVPDGCQHNGHMFYILLEDLAERDRMIAHLEAHGISAYFHYVPLHKAPYWQGKYDGLELPVTESVSDRLLRLPMYYDLSDEQIERVCQAVKAFKPW